MKVRAILNPRAGVAARRTRQAIEGGRPGWLDYAVYLTRAPGHATELAREAVDAGAEVVLAVGGDGTVNEVALGLLGSESALGIVPAGSGNGLARALRLPLQPRRALAALEGAERRAMDVGVLNGRVFLNVAGVGFDAAVGHAFHARGERGGRRGLLGYLYQSLRELTRYRAPRVELEIDGRPPDVRSPFVLTFANGPQYGSSAVINPGGKLDDGRLEVVIFEPERLPDTLLAAARMFWGGIEGARGYDRRAALHVIATSSVPLPVHVDGDPAPAAARIEVELRPRALTVLVPQAGSPCAAFTAEPA